MRLIDRGLIKWLQRIDTERRQERRCAINSGWRHNGYRIINIKLAVGFFSFWFVVVGPIILFYDDKRLSEREFE